MRVLHRFIPVILVITILITAFALSGGCSAPEESSRLSELLTLIPATKSVKDNLIIICDYALALESVGISLEELDVQSTTFQEFTNLLRKESVDLSQIANLPTSFIIGWGKYADTGPICDTNVGYSVASTDAGIQAGSPPNEMTAAVGRYNPEATHDALDRQDEWPSWAVDAYSTEKYHGVTIHTWGDGYETHMLETLVPPHIDMLGRAKPLAVTGEYLLSTASLDLLRSMIDASQDKAESLADLPEYADVIARMSELGIYTILMGDESQANDYPRENYTYSGPRLKKFTTFGSAPGTDEKGEFIALVLYHEDPEDARANVSLFEERIVTTTNISKQLWSILIPEIDIQAEGNLLVAKLYTEEKILWATWVYNYEPLLLHEQ